MSCSTLRHCLSDSGLILERLRSQDQALLQAASDEGRDCDLHRVVSPSRWCLTQEDLRQLGRVVRAGVRSGQIVPTPRDAFDPSDDLVGPNMYTVNEQLIRPTTLGAGCSWALMKHPQGLDCDVFITHAWVEGIYEFIQKVLASWPKGAKHAWCCVFAMPQNAADLGDLIAVPENSPFKVALERAKYVMVVPNRQGSIYTRLWCVYEAYVAYTQGKVIFTARRPVGSTMFKACIHMLVALALGMFIRYAIPSRYDIVLSFFGTALYVSATTSYIVADNFTTAGIYTLRVLNMACLLTAAVVFTPTSFISQTFEETVILLTDQVLPIALIPVVHYYLVSRMRLRAECDKLKAHHGGQPPDIDEADCTDEVDRAAIRTAIRDDVAEVSRSIDVLVRSGVSTPELRRLAAMGINVTRAGDERYGAAIMAWLSVVNAILKTAMNNHNVAAASALLAAAGLVLPVVWREIYRRQHMGRKAFSCQAAIWFLSFSAVLVRIAELILGVCKVPPHPPTHQSGLLGDSTCNGSYVMASWWLGLSSCFTILVSAVGPARIAAFPVGGYTTARVLVEGPFDRYRTDCLTLLSVVAMCIGFLMQLAGLLFYSVPLALAGIVCCCFGLWLRCSCKAVETGLGCYAILAASFLVYAGVDLLWFGRYKDSTLDAMLLLAAGAVLGLSTVLCCWFRHYSRD